MPAPRPQAQRALTACAVRRALEPTCWWPSVFIHVMSCSMSGQHMDSFPKWQLCQCTLPEALMGCNWPFALCFKVSAQLFCRCKVPLQHRLHTIQIQTRRRPGTHQSIWPDTQLRASFSRLHRPLSLSTGRRCTPRVGVLCMSTAAALYQAPIRWAGATKLIFHMAHGADCHLQYLVIHTAQKSRPNETGRPCCAAFALVCVCLNALLACLLAEVARASSGAAFTAHYGPSVLARCRWPSCRHQSVHW